jgi:nucleoside-diphosphate-sugar epimerase
MNILITGANGFIGRALCDKLIADEYQVRGAVRGATQMTVLPSGVEGVMVGDIGPETDWSEALSGIDDIVHLAARVHVMRESVADPLAAFRQVNVEGTKRLARQASEAGVKRLVYISSVKVHGEENDIPYSEEDTSSFQDPYGVSKYEAEEVLKKVAAETGLEIVILRPPLVYGPGVKANFLRLLKLIHKRIPLPLGLVHNRRSMVYLGNLVSAIMICLKHPRAAGETFLVSDGKDISTADLVRKMASVMGHRATLLPVPLVMLKALGSLTGERAEIDRLTSSLRVDSSKIRELLDWQAPYTFEHGIQETVDWYQSFMFTR